MSYCNIHSSMIPTPLTHPQVPQAQRGIACKRSQLPCDLSNHLLSGQNIYTNVTINRGCN